MKFRPCIDLHRGAVKQIVGGTLSAAGGPTTHFTSVHPPSYYAQLYRHDGLNGGHVIMLGPGNDQAAADALAAWPGGMQVGGGVDAENAPRWIDRGASAVIVTSYVFHSGRIDRGRLRDLVRAAGRERLTLDLSCRKLYDRYVIVTDRWQTFTEVAVNRETLEELANYCSEFLIHAVDVEGLCSGVEADLARLLGECTPLPTTYAGGVSSLEDIELIRSSGRGRLDYTVGAALDLFGGSGLRYADLVALNRRSESGTQRESTGS